jgi:AcrR family transcriptional regulator
VAKRFSEQEREIINKKLLEACEECWEQYGYRKTTVEEICRRSGISTGAFYLFYPSKEHLFVDTSQSIVSRLVVIMEDGIPPRATRGDFAGALKQLIKKLEEMAWFMTLGDDMEMITRKLPAGFFENASVMEIANFSELIKKYALVPKVGIDEVTAVLRSLTAMVHIRKIVGPGFDAAYDFILDTVIGKLFR